MLENWYLKNYVILPAPFVGEYFMNNYNNLINEISFTGIFNMHLKAFGWEVLSRSFLINEITAEFIAGFSSF